MNNDADGDGIPDLFDNVARIGLMEGARILEALMARHRALAEAQAHQMESVRQAATARLRAEATQSRYRLEPVMSDNWWARADLDTIGRRYAEAKAWDGIDPSFMPFVDRIEERAKALHDLDPDHILDAVKAKDRVPLTVDEARAVAAQQAPQWYRVHDRLVTDLPPFVRAQHEERLVGDMTHMRDTGKLDTDSAKMEWAKFTDHRPALRHQRDDENLTDYQDATRKAAAEHWDLTGEARRAVSAPLHADGAVVARPMSVGEARRFAELYAPDWFQFGHEQNRNAQVSEHYGENEAHATRMDDQMRYAMETLRDTGTMSHPYAVAMRESLSHNPEFDTAMGPKPVSHDARIVFGGSPTARPLTDGEAIEVMTQYAPEWYRKPMLDALSPESILTPEARAGQVDLIRADMTALRDRGTLSTDHAMQVWAAQQPEGRVPDDSPFGNRPTPVEVWAQTVERRQEPVLMPQEAREGYGGITVPKEPFDASQRRPEVYEGPVTQAIPVVGRRRKRDDQEWDTVARRDAQEERLRAGNHTESSIKAWRISDILSGKPGGTIDPEARQSKPAKGSQQAQVRRHKRGM